MLANINESVQHVILKDIPVDVLARVFLWFRQVTHFECHAIRPPQEVQCVHMYSVAWDVLVICNSHYLAETEGGRRGEGLCEGNSGVEAGGSCERSWGGGVCAQMCARLCTGKLCVWELYLGEV